jgi:nitrite reductase/ring-hydroxylating ferredoxin subunit
MIWMSSREPAAVFVKNAWHVAAIDHDIGCALHAVRLDVRTGGCLAVPARRDLQTMG